MSRSIFQRAGALLCAVRNPVAFRLGNAAFILAIVALGTTAVQADPVDPQGVFDNLVAGTPVMPESDFTFGADATGGGVLSFQNVSGTDWIAMDFTVTEPQGISITCNGGPFFGACITSSTNTSPNMAQYRILFSRPINGGIPNQAEFSFNLNDLLPTGGPNFDPNGAGGWGAGADFTVVPTSGAPEPASWLLLTAGLPLIGLARRLSSLYKR